MKMQARPKAKVRRTQEHADTSTGRDMSDTDDEELIPVPGTEDMNPKHDPNFITGSGVGDLSTGQDEDL